MTRLPIFQVDAFTCGPFTGNPAAVVLLEEPLPDATLLAIAAANNLSETAYLLRGDDGLGIRWFTPLAEADLCGHATLASAHVAFAEAIGASRRAQLTFELATRGGGYAEVELGYAFQPFRVRDPVGRPLLGLTIAQRLCELLGGELSIDSPGRSVCHYRMIVEAAPVADAEWVDPVGRPGQARLGRVQPQE